MLAGSASGLSGLKSEPEPLLLLLPSLLLEELLLLLSLPLLLLAPGAGEPPGYGNCFAVGLGAVGAGLEESPGYGNCLEVWPGVDGVVLAEGASGVVVSLGVVCEELLEESGDWESPG